MKKFLSVVLTVVLIITALPLSTLTLAASDTKRYTDGLYTYEISNKKATILAADKAISGDIVIPKTLGGYPVTCISNEAFYDCEKLTKVTISKSVTVIYENAFAGCTKLESVIIRGNIKSINEAVFSNCSSLKSIKIPEGVTSIGDAAFASCSSLKSIKIPKTVRGIGYNAFASCTALESLVLPESLYIIWDAAFAGCTSLKSIKIPENVIYIYNGAFANCTSLESVTIPAKTKEINNAFSNCSSLKSINVSENNLNYTSVDGVLFNKNKTSIIQYPIGKKETEYVIPDGVTEIGSGYSESVFGNSNNLKKIILPNSIIKIHYGVFEGCSALTSITIPEGTTDIMNFAFQNCSSLESINVSENNLNYTSVNGVLFDKSKTRLLVYPTGKKDAEYIIPDGVTVIDSSAFLNCKHLTKVTIPNSVKLIRYHAFDGCSALEGIVIPDKVRNIEYFAFENCTSLAYVKLGARFRRLYEDTFRGCSSLEKITVSEDNLNYCSIDGVVFNKDKTTLVEYPENRKAIKYTVPDGVTTIWKYAFEDCSNLKKLILPASLKKIGSRTFYNCTSLENFTVAKNNKHFSSANGVLFNKKKTILIYYPMCKSATEYVIPDGVEILRSDAFRNCQKLKSITLPESLKKTGYDTFEDCKNIKNVYYSGNKTDRNNIKGVSSEEGLSNAKWHYNICVGKTTHKNKNIITKATLKKNGKVVKKCSVCGRVASTTTVYYPKTVKIAKTTYTYTGKVIKPAITVKGANGKAIAKTNYTVTYAKDRKNVGKYKVTVTFKGNYKGTKAFYFTINPVKTTVNKLVAGNKSLKVTIGKKTKQVTGYEIQYATNKTFKSAKKVNVKSYKTTTVTLNKLAAKKTYYVRVRTYKTVGKTKYYSAWSTAKNKKTK